MNTITKNNVIIPANEYNYLKRIEKTFEQFFSSFSYLKDIEKARKEVKKKQYLSQDVLLWQKASKDKFLKSYSKSDAIYDQI